MILKSLLSHDFRHAAINQLWKLISGPLVLFFVPVYLTAEAQGYWYTFISLAALAVFADMGFSSVLLLFSAHEFAHLEFGSDKKLSGSAQHLDRLATLWRFAMKWSMTMAFAVFPLVLVVGFFILSGKGSSVEWALPWFIYGVASVFVFINSMALSFIEGCDSVGDVQRIRFQISVITVSATLLFLYFGADLYALAFSLLAGAVSGAGIMLRRYKGLLAQLNKEAKNKTHPWFKEIMPLIWRYAVSWVSGYFIFSVFTPVAFHYYGAIEAGQVGLSMAICAAIFSISNIWIVIITPKINMCVAKCDYRTLNIFFKRHLLLAFVTYVLGAGSFFCMVYMFRGRVDFLDRLLPDFQLFIIVLAWFFQVLISSLAIYMRAHKQEPLVMISFLNGLYVLISTVLISIFLPFEYFFVGFFSAYIWILPWVYVVFKKKCKSYCLAMP